MVHLCGTRAENEDGGSQTFASGCHAAAGTAIEHEVPEIAVLIAKISGSAFSSSLKRIIMAQLDGDNFLPSCFGRIGQAGPDVFSGETRIRGQNVFETISVG
jgi:hypothetical protein